MTALITLPEELAGEREAISLLCRCDGVVIHLRRDNPEPLARTVWELCGGDERLLGRFTLHHAPALSERYGFGGTHRRFSERNGECHGRLSVSCHSFDEVRTVLDEGQADYMFLSPVFDSHSKKGYMSAFGHRELERFLGSLSDEERRKVMALGGVDADNMALCRNMGFGGTAMIGSLWAVSDGAIDPEATLSNYMTLESRWLTETR